MAAGDLYNGSFTANTSDTIFSRSLNSNTYNGHIRDGVLWEFTFTDSANTAVSYTVTGSGSGIDGYGGYVVTGAARIYDVNNCLLSTSGNMTFAWAGSGVTGFFSFPDAGVFKTLQAFQGSSGTNNVSLVEE